MEKVIVDITCWTSPSSAFKSCAAKVLVWWNAQGWNGGMPPWLFVFF